MASKWFDFSYVFSVMSCDAPPVTDGGTFTCADQTTEWNGECDLECLSEDGYTGDVTITCNVDKKDETVGWDSEPTCAG